MRGNQWIVLTTVVILSLVLAACGSTPTPIPPTATPTPLPPTATPTPLPPTATPTPTPTPTPPSPEAMLEVALSAMATESYRFEMEMQMEVTEAGISMEIPITLTGDFQPPDSLQSTMSMTFMGMTLETEIITIGETGYVTDIETGEWTITSEQVSPFSPEDFTGIEPADIEELAIVGEETLDGTPVYHLTGTAFPEDLGDAMAGAEGELQLDYWIGVEDSRLRQNSVEGELSVEGLEGGTIGLTATTVYSDYGQTVAIVAPELPTPIPVATFQPAAPTPAPPVSEAMGQLEPGWTSYLTGTEATDNLSPSGTLVGSPWSGAGVAADGALWFTTLGAGVFRFDGATWTRYSEEDGLASDIVLSVTEGRGPLGGTGSLLWFATSEGICHFDGETWTSYPESADLASGPGPTALGPDGMLWYGTAKGATVFDGETWTTYTTADGLVANYVLDMVVGADGALWIGTNGGVSRFDGETWTTYTMFDGLAHDRVASIALAPDGALWFGTEGGVSRFDGETWTTYTTADGLADDDVAAVAAAGSVLWFGTAEGVSRFDGETWTTYTSADGLADDEVNALEVAPDGAVWFATPGGISRYMPEDGAAPAAAATPLDRTDVIVIGMNTPLTGDIPGVGEETRFTAEMWLEDIEAAGGLEVGGKTYQVELALEDNQSRGEEAAAVNTKLITRDQALVIVGPQSSKQAVPAGGIANDLRCPMISPWSTNPNTTLDRPWVFRAGFLDTLQGSLVARFLTEEFEFTKAAILYESGSDYTYSSDLAGAFRETWEELHGDGSVVASETFSVGATDFATQLAAIKDSGAEFLFTPQYYNEVPLIVQQAHDLGYEEPIVGSDSWGSSELMELCGDDCTGLFFCTHFVPAGATGAAKEFVERYEEQYGYLPTDAAALTWDSLLIVQQAIQDCGEISGDIEADRQCVRDALAGVEAFEGITGKLTFDEEGNPIKCAVMARISDEGEFEFYQWACPEELE